MPRHTVKRPSAKKRPQSSQVPLKLVVPAILVATVIALMPSMLTGSLSWPWAAEQLEEPVDAPVPVEPEAPLDPLVEVEPACCVGGSVYYGYEQMQCAGAGGTWELSGFCIDVPEYETPQSL